MSERVSVNAQEFHAFLSESQQLVERYEELLGKLSSLTTLNKDLEEKLRLAQEKITVMEQKMGGDVQQADEILRKARATMARLMGETDRRLSG